MRSLLAVVFPFLALACTSSSGGAPAVTNAGNGVNDVVGACNIRKAWQGALESTCLKCKTNVALAPCECSPGDPFAGKCLSQSKVHNAEVDCSPTLDQCVGRCADDCACLDACYAGHDACRKAAAALDGCQADVCDSTCR